MSGVHTRFDPLAVTAGAVRLSSGVSFLVAPATANRLWGDNEEPSVATSVLLRSMGYRDALIGALLLNAAVRRKPSTAAWFLASAGADAADLLGGWSVHDRMSMSQKGKGLGGAALGIAVGLWGASRVRRGR